MTVKDIELTIPEIFELINDASSKNERIQILSSYKYNKALKDILRGAFDPSISWVDFDDVEWAPDDAPLGLNPSHLHMEMKPDKINRFRTENANGLSYERVVSLFQDMMSALHESEANVMMAMFKKKLEVKGLNRKLIKQVFPQLIKE